MSRADIHPKLNEVIFKCSCGASYSTLSTMEADNAGVISLEICSGCHPFYTGKQKLIDTAGRVDRFKRMYGQRGGQSKTSNAGEQA